MKINQNLLKYNKYNFCENLKSKNDTINLKKNGNELILNKLNSLNLYNSTIIIYHFLFTFKKKIPNVEEIKEYKKAKNNIEKNSLNVNSGYFGNLNKYFESFVKNSDDKLINISPKLERDLNKKLGLQLFTYDKKYMDKVISVEEEKREKFKKNSTLKLFILLALASYLTYLYVVLPYDKILEIFSKEKKDNNNKSSSKSEQDGKINNNNSEGNSIMKFLMNKDM